MTEYLFWLSFTLIIYIYFGYPILIFAISKICAKDIRKSFFEPSVSVLISAYNEESSIGNTIENKLQINYPKGKLEIIVISDGSTDRTDDIVKKYSEGSVRLFRQEPRAGKTSALNMGIAHARGEILVFSDANSMYEKDALLYLVENFIDPTVGYVTGKMIYSNPDGTVTGDGCSAYMKYENFLRHHETRLGSVVGVDGGIDAVRKSIYRPMLADQLPDFILPLMVIEQGYRVVYEPRALLKEDALKSLAEEYKMRVRVSLRALWALYDMRHLLNPLKYGLFSWQIFSHKILRYMVFALLISVYISNAFLWNKSISYKSLFLAQNMFYLIAYVGMFQKKGNGVWAKVTFVPYYFTLLNLAAGLAFWKFLKREKQVVWTPRVG